VARLTDRTLDWDACLNVRDLGGHAIEGGGETRRQRVVRADALRRLSDEGWAAAVAYGVRTVVDLRRDAEREADPPRELPVAVTHVELVPEGDTPDALPSLAGFYANVLEAHGSRIGRVIRTIAHAPDGVVLVHCEAGKDRTGIVVALLLRLAGVATDAVADDYALSAPNVASFVEPWIAKAKDDRERAIRAMIGGGDAATITETLTELEHRHGSVREYLLTAGVAEADIDRVKRRLTE
jgi:protein-tyrosine phosphatase